METATSAELIASRGATSGDRVTFVPSASTGTIQVIRPVPDVQSPRPYQPSERVESVQRLSEVVIAGASAALSFGLVGAAFGGPFGATVGMVAGVAAARAVRLLQAHYAKHTDT